MENGVWGRLFGGRLPKTSMIVPSGAALHGALELSRPIGVRDTAEHSTRYSRALLADQISSDEGGQISQVIGHTLEEDRLLPKTTVLRK